VYKPCIQNPVYISHYLYDFLFLKPLLRFIIKKITFAYQNTSLGKNACARGKLKLAALKNLKVRKKCNVQLSSFHIPKEIFRFEKLIRKTKLDILSSKRGFLFKFFRFQIFEDKTFCFMWLTIEGKKDMKTNFLPKSHERCE